jgi:hypothetical protein
MSRTMKRKLAHQLYPEPAELADLTDEHVPYLYARAYGFRVNGTGWFDVEPDVAGTRTMLLIQAAQIAVLADALAQGLTGADAWRWAEETLADESLECVWDRAAHYGIPFDSIRPYSCGPEPEQHDHVAAPDARGYRLVTRVRGRESQCPDCTEEIEAAE